VEKRMRISGLGSPGRVWLAARLLPVLLACAWGLHAQAPGKGLVIVLIGPPGSGKTTQSALLEKKYHIPILAGKELRAKAGNSSDKMNALVREEVLRAERQKGFVIDGYPATRAEADYLAKLVKEIKLPAPIVIQLDVPDAEVRRRLGSTIDRAELDRQLAVYHKELELARSYYPEADIWEIIGTLEPKEVFKTIVALVEDRQ